MECLPGKKIAFSLHFYASDAYHQQPLRNKANKAIGNGMPLLVTAWGVGEASGNGAFKTDKANTWVRWLADNKLSWAIWNLTDKAETPAILLPGAATTGGWREGQLTPSGRYIRSLLRKLNSP